MISRKRTIIEAVYRWGKEWEFGPNDSAVTSVSSCSLCSYSKSKNDTYSVNHCGVCPVVESFGEKCMGDDENTPFGSFNRLINWTNEEVFTAACFLAAIEDVEI